MSKGEVPHDLEEVLTDAWAAAKAVPGFLVENEARLLGMIAACTPATGAIVEIGSFKGKSTVMLGKVAQHYGFGPVVAIDPHDLNSDGLQALKTSAEDSTYRDFLANVASAGVSDLVIPHRALSTQVAQDWDGPIRFLWIDGDHSYRGAKDDFDGFIRHLVPGGVVAFHDALNTFAGPIRVFVEDVLRSNSFGPAGFVHSIAWAQYRPHDGARFEKSRTSLARRAARLVPLVKENRPLRGLQKIRYKLNRSQVPRAPIAAGALVSLLDQPGNP
ncbi:MAG: class I SAM-dependent methyltransferase [Acidobacteriota bacterium]